MTTYIDVAAYIRGDPIENAIPVSTIRGQVQSAIKDAAINISGEVDTTDNYARRLSLATGVANATGAQLERYVEVFLPSILLNGNGSLWASVIQPGTDELADSDVLSAVAGLWNTIAGREVTP